MPQLFISYVREDKDRVLEIVEELKRYEDITVWIDLDDIGIGEEFTRVITQAILESDHYVPIFSRKFNDKLATVGNFYMLEELRIAKRLLEQKTEEQNWTLPILLDDCALPDLDVVDWLKTINYANLSLGKKEQFLKLLTKILRRDVTEHDRSELSFLSPFSKHDREMNDLEKLLKEFLYYHPFGYVKAVNLFGAGMDFITEDRIVILYQQENEYVMPEALEGKGSAHIEEQRSTGRKVFNGPTARLMSFKHECVEGEIVALEKSKLTIALSPINWFDYLMTNDVVRGDYKEAVNYFDYHDLLQGDISRVELSNITETIITIVSNDGFVGYQIRQTQAVGTDLYSGAVAENINRYLDEVDPEILRLELESSGHKADFHLHVLNDVAANNPHSQISETTVADGNYRLNANSVPHPFLTVRRGIFEELSPDLLKHMKPFSIKLVGISFDLIVFHPNFLFSVFVDLSADEIVRYVLQNPGKDFREGRIRFVKAAYDDPETLKILQRKNWAPGGEASLVRTINLISAFQENLRMDFSHVFRILENAR